METKATCNSDFLFDAGLDHALYFERWAPLMEAILSKGCDVYIDEDWGTAFGHEGSVLHHETTLPFKELKDFLIVVLPRMVSSPDFMCSGRAVPAHCLCIDMRDGESKEITCEGENVTVAYADSPQGYQAFWRTMIDAYANDHHEFDLHVDQAFWQLELGPAARNGWGSTGHAFANIKRCLVQHLAYLNDEVIDDWAEARYQDPAFSARAQAKGVLLSRDESAAGARRYEDGSGALQPCRHHTKLSPQGHAVSPHHGGRIYFAVENREIVLVGKVCEHD